jgi:hypothetical protein
LAYLCSQWEPNVQIKYFMFDCSIYRLFVLNRGCKLDSLSKEWYSNCFFDMNHSWTKYAFWDVYNKKWRKWCKFALPFFFSNNYGLPVLTMDTKCTNQVFYVWSIYRLLVLNRGWKRVSPNNYIHIFLLDMRHSWTRNAFVTWIRRKDVNGVSLFHLFI